MYAFQHTHLGDLHITDRRFIIILILHVPALTYWGFVILRKHLRESKCMYKNWDNRSSHFAVRNNKCISNRPQTKVRERGKNIFHFTNRNCIRKRKTNTSERYKFLMYIKFHIVLYSKCLSPWHNLFYTYIIPIMYSCAWYLTFRINYLLPTSGWEA